jgi:ribosome-associated toxin RatA of RatAB toxin-antitoxin module
MPTVTAELTIPAEPDRLFTLARDQVERFPEFTDDLVSVTVLEREGIRSVSRWVGRIKEFNRTLEWTEEDEWDPEARTCRFWQREGDFTSYSGLWEFQPGEAGGCLTRMTIDYEYNIPLVGALIQGLVKKKVQQSAEAILQALQGLAAAEL